MTMDDVLTELRLLDEHSDRMFGAVRVYMDENTRQHQELWADLAELRDALLALANRIEANTRTPFTPRLPYLENAQVCADCSGSGEVGGERCQTCKGFGEVRVNADAK